MNQIQDFEKKLERLKVLAALLEKQMGKCPASELRFCTWIAAWTRTPQGLRDAEKDLPRLPEALRYDSAAWIHDGAK